MRRSLTRHKSPVHQSIRQQGLAAQLLFLKNWINWCRMQLNMQRGLGGEIVEPRWEDGRVLDGQQ